MSMEDNEDESAVSAEDERLDGADMWTFARALWSEVKLAGNPNVPADARKEMWIADRHYYLRLARRVRGRLNRRGLDIGAKGDLDVAAKQ